MLKDIVWQITSNINHIATKIKLHTKLDKVKSIKVALLFKISEPFTVLCKKDIKCK